MNRWNQKDGGAERGMDHYVLKPGKCHDALMFCDSERD